MNRFLRNSHLLISFFGLFVYLIRVPTAVSNLVSAAYYIGYSRFGDSMLSICLKDFSIKDNILKSVLAIGIPAALGDVLMSVSNIIWNRIFKDFTYYQLSVWYVLCALQCITGYGSSYSRIDYQYEPSGTDLYTCRFYSSGSYGHGQAFVGTAVSRCFISSIGRLLMSSC